MIPQVNFTPLWEHRSSTDSISLQDKKATKLSEWTNLLDTNFDCTFPMPGLSSDCERAHSAAFPTRITVIQLNTIERWVGTLHEKVNMSDLKVWVWTFHLCHLHQLCRIRKTYIIFPTDKAVSLLTHRLNSCKSYLAYEVRARTELRPITFRLNFWVKNIIYRVHTCHINFLSIFPRNCDKYWHNTKLINCTTS